MKKAIKLKTSQLLFDCYMYKKCIFNRFPQIHWNCSLLAAAVYDSTSYVLFLTAALLLWSLTTGTRTVLKRLKNSWACSKFHTVGTPTHAPNLIINYDKLSLYSY